MSIEAYLCSLPITTVLLVYNYSNLGTSVCKVLTYSA